MHTKYNTLTAAIEAYQGWKQAFAAIKESGCEAHGGEDAVIEMIYGPPHDALYDWTAPAETLEEAVLALQFASEQDQTSEGASELVGPMLRAALGYFKPQAGRFPEFQLKIAC